MYIIENGVFSDSPYKKGCTIVDNMSKDTLVIPSEDEHGQPVVEIKEICTSEPHIPLKAVIIPDTIKIIGENAFSHLKQLTEIYIPASVESISEGFAMYCPSLKKITVDPENKFYDSRNNSNAIICKKTNTLVQGCCNTIIPHGVKVIGRSAFQGCRQLETIAIPDSVTTISDSSFYDCSNLENILIPSSVSKIGDHAFDFCRSLTSLHLTDSVIEIGSHAFEACDNMYYMRIPSEVKIDNDAFFYTFSKHVIISTTLSKTKELIARFHDLLEGALFAIQHNIPGFGEEIELLDMKGALDRIEIEKKRTEQLNEMKTMMEKYKEAKKDKH